jgi:hypothetical protein
MRTKIGARDERVNTSMPDARLGPDGVEQADWRTGGERKQAQTTDYRAW